MITYQTSAWRLVASLVVAATVILASHHHVGPPLAGHASTIWTPAFSPDASLSALGGNGLIEARDVASRR